MVEKVHDGLGGVNSSRLNLLSSCKDVMFEGIVNRILCRILCHTLFSAAVMFNAKMFKMWWRNKVTEKECKRPEFSRHNKSGRRQQQRDEEQQKQGGWKKDEGDPPVIAGVTWGPSQGLGLILKWPETLQTQQASKQSWLHCGMSLPHWPTHFTNITVLLATARLADQHAQHCWCVMTWSLRNELETNQWCLSWTAECHF